MMTTTRAFFLALTLVGTMAVSIPLQGCDRVGGDGTPSGNKVLLLSIDDDASESFGIDAFNAALASGGQVKITSDEIVKAYPEFQTFSPTNPKGSYMIQGAAANFVCSKGWRFHSRDIGGLIFVKD